MADDFASDMHHAAVVLEMEVPPGWTKSEGYREFLNGIERLMLARPTDNPETSSGPGGAILGSLHTRVENSQSIMGPIFKAMTRMYRSDEDQPLLGWEWKAIRERDGEPTANRAAIQRYCEITSTDCSDGSK